MTSNLINVKIKMLNDNAKMPTQGSDAAAGYDVYACLDQTILINPGETVKVGTGIAVQIPEDYWMGIFARSGLATKEGLRPANCVGVVDPDYRGEIIVALHNDSNIKRQIAPAEKIGQLILLPRFTWKIQPVKELNDTKRGNGGFGSTGK